MVYPTKTGKGLKLLCAAALIMTLLFCVAFDNASRVSHGAELEGVTYGDYYRTGETLKIQKGSISALGKTQAASAKIFFPDGSAYTASEIQLSQVGEYRVEYRASIDGRLFKFEKKFKAFKNLYEVEGLGSAHYGEYDFADSSQPNIEGVIVSLKPGDTFIYNHTIDLTGKTREDILVSLNVTPQVIGETDFQYLKVTFTDKYDSSNYISVSALDVDDPYSYGDTTSYWKAAAYNQRMSGKDAGKPLIHIERYGLSLAASFHGMPLNNRTVAEDVFTVALDYQSRQVFGPDSAGRANNIIDLDDPEHFSALWEGFTTGEVYMSIEAEKHTKSTANFVITDIYGCDDLQDGYARDTDAPQIEIDYGSYSAETIPEGGVNLPYRLFDASAKDTTDGILGVVRRVYFGFYSENRVDVSVTGGVFVPVHAGTYTICYEAKDRAGNIDTEYVDIKINQHLNAVDLTLKDDGGAGVAGHEVRVKTPKASGGYGNTDIKITAECGDDKYVIDAANPVFTPMKSGVYTIKYLASDYTGQSASQSYSLTVSGYDKPVFLGVNENLIPKYFIAGYTYELPQISAYNFSGSGADRAAAVISVTNGTVAGHTFKPSAGGAVRITYTAEVDGKSTPLYFDREVVDIGGAGSLDLKKLFVASAGITSDYDGSGNTRYTAVSDSRIQFANRVYAEGFIITVGFDKVKRNFARVNLLLSDIYDGNTVNISLINSGGQIYLSVNGGQLIKTKSNLNDAVVSELIVSYSNLSRSVIYNNVEYPVTADSLGSNFYGFESQQIDFAMEFVGVTGGGAAVSVIDFCKQPMLKTVSLDRIKPQIILTGYYGGLYPKDAVVNLPKAYAFDVISPLSTKLTLTVKHVGSNSVITSLSGVPLDGVEASDYSFLADRYGVYAVSFTVTDGNGNIQVFSFVVEVIDSEPPQIVLAAPSDKVYKLNDDITVLSVTVSDNVSTTENIKTYIYVLKPDGSFITLDGNKFSATQTGKYTVYYFAMDQASNVDLKSYVITVK